MEGVMVFFSKALLLKVAMVVGKRMEDTQTEREHGGR